jgi:hypothetical protein
MNLYHAYLNGYSLARSRTPVEKFPDASPIECPAAFALGINDGAQGVDPSDAGTVIVRAAALLNAKDALDALITLKDASARLKATNTSANVARDGGK